MRLVLGLIRPKRCEELLVRWVNLREEAAACFQLFQKFPEVFSGLTPPGPIDIPRLIQYRNRLRGAWEAPDARLREWRIFEFRHAFQFQMNAYRMGIDHNQALIDAIQDSEEAREKMRALSDPGLEPDESPIEAALFYLQRAAPRIRICPNPDCGAKYFLRSPKQPKQTSCSPECADTVRKASKRRWWADNRGRQANAIYQAAKKGAA